MCGNAAVYTQHLHHHNNERVRRSSQKCGKYRSRKNTCHLKLIGDYKFFKKIGRGHEQTAIHQMAQVINRVNNIYKDTCWDGVGRGITFVLVLKMNKVTKMPEIMRCSTSRFNLTRDEIQMISEQRVVA